MSGRLAGKDAGAPGPDLPDTLSDLKALVKSFLRSGGVLHRQQIRLLSKWRELIKTGEQSEADAMLPDLLLSINAIASGLRTTG